MKLPISFVILTPDYLESFAPLDFAIDASSINNQEELEAAFDQQTKMNGVNFCVNHIFNIPNSNLDHTTFHYLWRVIELWKNTPENFKTHLGKQCSFINDQGYEIPNRTIIGFEDGEAYFLEDQRDKGYAWSQCVMDGDTWHLSVNTDSCQSQPSL